VARTVLLVADECLWVTALRILSVHGGGRVAAEELPAQTRERVSGWPYAYLTGPRYSERKGTRLNREVHSGSESGHTRRKYQTRRDVTMSRSNVEELLLLLELLL
jgi:hypothetical protein